MPDSPSMPTSDGQPLPHGYTNHTTASGGLVTKMYRGPGAVARQRREELALRSLAGLLPVATVVESRPGSLVVDKIAGRHGQDLIAAGDADAVMLALGAILREVQAIAPAFYDEFDGSGVLVHGDFGPQNALFAMRNDAVVLLADWEWSTVGSPVTDLAWAEFIVRMHHPEHVGSLQALFDGYGERPPWAARRAAMTERATAHTEWVRLWKGGDVTSEWDYRLRAIEQWRETT
jgi:hypothetical protein